MPGELRAHLKAADRDLLAVHRALAPDHKPIRIQRWTLRRIGALVGSATLAVAAIWLLVQNIALVGRFV
jgi:hypothetical protein